MRLHEKGGQAVPKQVDHEERRRYIADALLRIVAERGLDAASLRTVAAEAAVSMGAVQHYFKTKETMLTFALAHNHELLTRRVQQAVAELPQPTPTRAVYRRVLIELLPLGEESRRGARLGAAILARAAVDPQVAQTVRMAYTGVIEFLTRHLTTARDNGELSASLDVEHAARALNVVIEGLRWPALFGVYNEAETLAVLDEHLDRLFGPEH
jgi:TetR/AcrR family transcriptional repressor of bet genes